MANARPPDAVAKLSAAFTMATFAGLAGLVCVGLPVKAPVSGRTVAAVVPAPAAEPRQSNVEVVRTHEIDADAAQKQSSAEMQVAAGKPSKGSKDDSPPKSTWDGTPQHKSADPAADKSAPLKTTNAPAKDAPSGKTSEPASKGPVETPGSKPPDAAAPASPNGVATAVPVVDEWSPAEIAAALKECVKLLGPVAAEIEPVEAMRKGPCGAPAPVRLKSLGTTERIEFTPPVEINCALAVKLADWAEKVLQPTTRNMLNTRVTKVSGAAGYQCRNRYGLANAPLSEHALANAVDVPGFVLADGRTIKVATGWGPTARDLVAKADPGKKDRTDAKDKASEKPDVKSDDKTGAKDKGAAEPSGSPGKSGTVKDNDEVKPKSSSGRGEEAAGKGKPLEDRLKLAGLKGAAYQKLGAGPTVTAAQAPASAATALSLEARYLRELSKGACQKFGTVLGPEANDAHRDHFHFDIKARRKAAFCQ